MGFESPFTNMLSIQYMRIFTFYVYYHSVDVFARVGLGKQTIVL